MTSKFFTDKELACKCGCGNGLEDMEQAFLNRLDMLRTLFGGPLIITSGFRCRNYNVKIKGAKDSQHCLGKAVDISCVNANDRWKLVACAMSLGFGGVGLDAAFLHLDNRDSPKLLFLYPVKGE